MRSSKTQKRRELQYKKIIALAKDKPREVRRCELELLEMDLEEICTKIRCTIAPIVSESDLRSTVGKILRELDKSVKENEMRRMYENVEDAAGGVKGSGKGKSLL